MRLTRELVAFTLIGGLQLAVDTTLFLVFVEVVGLGPWSNMLSRGLAACLGYIANAKFSFAHRTGARLSSRQAWRYFLAWAALTGLGTVMVSWGHHWVGPDNPLMLGAAKLGSEGLLFVLGFSACRWWIFRPEPARPAQ